MFDGAGTLESTVSNFSNRIKRKLKEQEALADQSQRANDDRHARILHAMTSIRKALQETCKIRMGARFSLGLDISDWEGWPRLELILRDAEIPERIDYGMTVTAHDRLERGIIQIHLRSGETLAALEIHDAESLTRIPLVLKKAVRSFLDLTAEYVLNPAKPADKLEIQSRALEEQDTGTDDSKLQSENLFSDDGDFSNNLVSADGAVKPIE